MMRNVKTHGSRIIETIAHVLRIVAKENVHSGTWREFSALNGGKKDKIDTTKSRE